MVQNLKNAKKWGIFMYFYDKSLTFVLTNRFSVAIIYAELRRKAVIEKIKIESWEYLL